MKTKVVGIWERYCCFLYKK